MMQSTDPLFSFTTIQILRNCPHNFHKDAHNKGSSQIFTLGEFEGGEFMYEGKKHDVQYVRNGRAGVDVGYEGEFVRHGK